jgi:hypothetical protein
VDFIFQQETTIIGPTSGDLNIRFMDTAPQGFAAQNNFTISNVNFTRESNSVGFGAFIYGWNPSGTPYPAVAVSNVTFSNAEVSAAIFAEGNLTVSNSTFANLTSYYGGVAISSNYGAAVEINNSTFVDNKSTGQGTGGTVNTSGSLLVSNSTFESNESDFQAIYAVGADPKVINNSTFVGNSANSAAAVFFSEGGVIANSTFWNNGDADTYSLSGDGQYLLLFGNILANDTPTTVKLIDPTESSFDMGANLYTDSTFDDATSGSGSLLVAVADLKLSPLGLNQITPANIGATETVAVASDSVANDFYTADTDGINPTVSGEISLYTNGAISTLLPTTDQRGAARPFGAGYDVGAFELEAAAVEDTEEEVLANTGLPTGAGYLGLVALGSAAILGGSAGILRRRKKA